MVTRRELLAAGASAALASAVHGARADTPKSGQPSSCEVKDITVPGDYARRFTLLVPQHLLPYERVPLLVLLHGLGETVDERLGAFAWVERYGLGTAYDRLRAAPVAPISRRDDWGPGKLAELNARLATRPFRGIAVACPFTPDLPIGSSFALDGYAHWLADVVVPRARQEAPVLEGREHTTIGGCSLGAHFSLEAFLRRTDAFGAWGGVQTAISVGYAPLYADRIAKTLAKVGRRDVLVQTSGTDKFRESNEELSRALKQRGVRHDWSCLPGPHDQAWLRESGSMTTLLWHDERPRLERRAPAREL